MRKLFTIVVAVLLTATVWAQSPEKMSYQAVIKDASDNLVTSQAVGMQISILQGSASGTAVYVETQEPTTNANGLVSIEIGAGTVLNGDFTTIDWANGPYFIKTETDPDGATGGISYTITGTSQLLSVPYALHAKTAETVTGGIAETDPIFGASIASGITGTDTTNWNNKLESETDPAFTAWNKSYNDLTNTPSIIDSINEVIDTTTQFVRTEVDPVYTSSDASNITASDITNLGNLSGTNTGDQNLSGVLTQSNDGGATQIKNIADPTDKQDAATKTYVDALEQQIEAMQNSLINVGSIVKDYDGNIYGVVTIGTQKWMTENLKTTSYNDGTAIPLVTDNTAWSSSTTPAYCWYNNDKATYGNTYGALYNWHTVNAGNVCPTGWHVPSDAEWTTLTDYLGGTSVAGGKLKETGTTHWNTPNTGATNETGFTALPGGYRDDGGAFDLVGGGGGWWSSTEASAANAWYRSMYYSDSDVGRGGFTKEYGFSVRCLRD